MDETNLLEQKAAMIRGKIIEASSKYHVPHLGGCLSCVDILVVLYWKTMNINPLNPKRLGSDNFILSKGHAAPALFTTLAYKGFFSKQLLETYGQKGSQLGEHPAPDCVPGVEVATGSLGHGLSFALGKALAAKINNEKQHYYVLLGDGEINEGSVWEAAMFASAQNLSNVTAIIDYNKWQATGRSAEVMSLESISEKWRAFGWQSYDVNGHDLSSLCTLFDDIKKQKSNKPSLVVASTIKGKGVSFMEDDNNWHYRIPSKEDVVSAHDELGLLKL